MESPVRTILRVALYARVSTDEQRDGQTIQSQIDELRRFAEQKGWPVTDLYKDDGWSGSSLERPELDRLRDDASRGAFTAVLINDVDRLARDVTHLGVVKRDLERLGVQVIFRKLPPENTPTNNLLVNILGSFAEFERELIADRTRRGRRHKVETRKQFLGCLAPYGYRYVPKRHSASGEGDLQVMPAEAAVVREMFRWVDTEGLSARQVVARLNQTKMLPRKGGRWQRSSVLRILRSEIYAGIWHYNKHELRQRDSHAAVPTRWGSSRKSLRRRPRSEWIPVNLDKRLHIVDRSQWERVQRTLDRNLSFSPRHSKHNYLLRGLVRCTACSAAYVGESGHGRFYYRCASRCRKLPTVREDLLGQAVWDTVTRLVLDPDLIGSQVEALLLRARSEADRSAVERHKADRAFAQMAVEEERLIEAYRTGALSAALLGRELNKLDARRSALEARRAAVSVTSAQASEQLLMSSVAEFLRSAALRLTTFTFAERQRFLRLIIQSIAFEGDRIKIIGHIPLSGEIAVSPTFVPTEPPAQPANPVPESLRHQPADAQLAPIQSLSCRIMPTEIEGCGRNPEPIVEFDVVAALRRPAATRTSSASCGTWSVST